MAFSRYILGVSLLVIAGVLSEDLQVDDLPDLPPKVSFNISNGPNYCIMVNGGIRFAVNYVDSNQKNVTAQFDLPANATGTGKCTAANDTQELTINVLPGWELKMTFKQNTTEKNWFLGQVDLSYAIIAGKAPFPNAGINVNKTASLKGQSMYKTGINSSFQCVSAQNINFTDSNVLGYETARFQVQAFHFGNETKFDSAIGCQADQVSNIVPIAVGAALGALVIIVLIAYFIGRSRNKRGYESV